MSKIDDINDILSSAVIDLFNQERFYAELIMQMDRIVTDKIPTAGVCIKDKIQLHINPEFFANLSKEERVAILKHEAGHILHDHIARFKAIAPNIYEKTDDLATGIVNNAKHMSLNIAADCALNCDIANLPKGAQLPANYDLPDGETMEWYHGNLKNNEKMKEMTNFDGHELWSESEGNSEVIKEKIRQAIEGARAKTKAAGCMSYDNELLISRLHSKAKDWRTILRQFVSKQMSYELESTRKKRNRRYGIAVPGYVKLEKLHLGVAIDTSGSVSDSALIQFMSEIKNISRYAEITIIEADNEIKNVYKYDPKKVYSVKGRGGTAYKPAFDYFTEETDVDGVVYFGDMDCYDVKTLAKPKYPVLWAIVGEQDPPAEWGRRVNIEIHG